MHELSLCQSAVEIIQRQAEQHDVKRVTAVWLEIGALSCVEESAVRFSFEIVCHGTVAQGCDLHIVYKTQYDLAATRPGLRAGIAARWWRFISTMRSVRSVTASGCVSIAGDSLIVKSIELLNNRS